MLRADGSALRTELRRSPALALLPVLLGLGVMAAWRALLPGVFIWRNGCQAVVESVQLTGPVAAGIACWAAGRDARRGTGYLHALAGRGPVAGPLLQLAAMVAWTLVSYVVLLAATIAWVAPRATWGGPMWLWLVVGAAALALHPVLGFAVGRLWPKVFAPPLVALAFYLVETMYCASHTGIGTWAGRFVQLSPVTVQGQDVFSYPRPALFWGQLLWYLGLAAAFPVLWALGTRSLRAAMAAPAVAAVVAATAAGAGLVIAQNGSFFGGNEHVTYVCKGSAPTICVHPAYSDSLAQLRSGLRPMYQRLAGTRYQADRFVQEPTWLGVPPPPRGTMWMLLRGMSPGGLQGIMQQMASEVMPPEACDSADYTATYLGVIVYQWLSGGSPYTPLYDSSAITHAARWFYALPQARREAWLDAHGTAAHSCTLTPADFR